MSNLHYRVTVKAKSSLYLAMLKHSLKTHRVHVSLSDLEMGVEVMKPYYYLVSRRHLRYRYLVNN